MSTGDARILGGGYRRFEGDRHGVGASMRATAVHAAQRALGLRRSGWAKVTPIGTVILSYVPAVVFVGLAALLPENLVTEGVLPGYGFYYSFISAALLLFAAIVGPELLVPDRSSGMLGLYLAAPLTRTTYLAAKAVAMLVLMAVVTVGPPLLMLIAFTLEGAGPDDPVEFTRLLLRIVASGTVLAVLYAALALAAGALAARRAAAAAGLIGLALVSSTAVGVLVFGLELPSWLLGFHLLAGPFELVQRIHGEASGDPIVESASTAALAGTWLVWVGLSVAVIAWRYRRVEVTR